jgi:hypothetical protein
MEALTGGQRIAAAFKKTFSVFPYHMQIVDHFKAKKVGLGLHICGYILSSGCEVPAIAPLEKIDWFNELVDELGRYN